MMTNEQRASMESMMDKCFGAMGKDDKKQMLHSMMGKMTEGMDMKDMMPMMMGMMSGGDSPCAGGMSDMMGDKMKGMAGPKMQAMPEMMLGQMMPHCLGMMLPMIEAERRGDLAANLVSALLEKGMDGMSEDEKRAYREKLGDVLGMTA